MRKSTIMKEIHAKIGKQSTENIHYSKRLHYYEIHTLLPDVTVFLSVKD